MGVHEGVEPPPPPPSVAEKRWRAWKKKAQRRRKGVSHTRSCGGKDTTLVAAISQAKAKASSRHSATHSSSTVPECRILSWDLAVANVHRAIDPRS